MRANVTDRLMSSTFDTRLRTISNIGNKVFFSRGRENSRICSHEKYTLGYNSVIKPSRFIAAFFARYSVRVANILRDYTTA